VELVVAIENNLGIALELAGKGLAEGLEARGVCNDIAIVPAKVVRA
jgi:hypothetical protein